MIKLFVNICILALLTSFLSGCEKRSSGELQSASTVQSNMQTTVVGSVQESVEQFQTVFSAWDLIVGEIPTSGETIAKVDANETSGGMQIFGDQYCVFYYTEEVRHFIECGWRIDLSMLSYVGKTDSGKTIFAPTQNTPPFFIAIDEAGQHCYFLENFFNNGIASFEFSDFDVVCTNSAVTKNEIEELVWLYHTEKIVSGVRGYSILDSSHDNGKMQLTHHTYPALQYTINFYISEGQLFMQDATYEPDEGLIVLPTE